VPQVQTAITYTFHIAEGKIIDEISFRKAAFVHQKVQKNMCSILLPSFGKQYTW
jgi:hypothetical protein